MVADVVHRIERSRNFRSVLGRLGRPKSVTADAVRKPRQLSAATAILLAVPLGAMLWVAIAFIAF